MDQQTRRFGLYEVSILHDGFYEAPIDVLTHAAGPAARDGAIATWGRPTLRIVVNCFLLRGPGGITLVDAGTGTAWGEAYGHARTALKSFGLTRESVDRARAFVVESSRARARARRIGGGPDERRRRLVGLGVRETRVES